MSSPITRPINENGVTPSYPQPLTSSVGKDESVNSHASGQAIRQVIQIDNGKSVSAIAICAAISGICAAVSIGLAMKLYQRETDIHAMQRTEYNTVLTKVQLLDNHVGKLSNDFKLEEERHERR